ncbi:hypothetical protein QR680_005239 [Steinernema hermaphroditum]|uniref:Endonuclease/exonuclease/phosphatase domain-containing protein n=1 Tax=Steinernema hermaphroditum TaxID=289476 RepID=A0AA39HTH9_9BILA|nr:hypothetical protein QR680_005239 [Steinernema hermaphroditum]
MARFRRPEENLRHTHKPRRGRPMRKQPRRPRSSPLVVDKVARDVVNDIATKFQTNIGPSQVLDFHSPDSEPIFHAITTPASDSRLGHNVVLTPQPKLAITKLNQRVTRDRTTSFVQIDDETPSTSTAVDSTNRVIDISESDCDSEIEIVHVELRNPQAAIFPEIICLSSGELEERREGDESIIIVEETTGNTAVAAGSSEKQSGVSTNFAVIKSVEVPPRFEDREVDSMKVPKFPPLVVDVTSIFTCGAFGNYAVRYRRSCAHPSVKFSMREMTSFRNSAQSTQEPAVFIDSLTYHSQLLYGVPLRVWTEIQRTEEVHSKRTWHLYKHASNFAYALEWEFRWTLMEKELRTLHADVFCLQEVYYEHYTTHFLPAMEKLGYIGHYERKAGGDVDVVDGSAIFYRRELFDEVCYRRVQMYAKDDTVLDKPNIGQVIRLRHKKTKRDLCVANTHLIYNTRSGHRKFAQLALLLAHLQEPEYIVCGDMNMEPFCDIYRFVLEKKLDLKQCKQREMSGQGEIGGTTGVPMYPPKAVRLKDNCTLAAPNENIVYANGLWTHGLNFASSYFHLKTDDQHDCSTLHSKSVLNPDFIFYSVKETYVHDNDTIQIQESGLRLLRRLELPDASEAAVTLGPWPNPHTPSDHVPLVVDFALV